MTVTNNSSSVRVVRQQDCAGNARGNATAAARRSYNYDAIIGRYDWNSALLTVIPTSTDTFTSPGHPHATRASTAPIRGSVTPAPRAHLSDSMSNLSGSKKKWNSTSDFRDNNSQQSPSLTRCSAHEWTRERQCDSFASSSSCRRMNAGSSLHSLRSPFGSQQNLVERAHFRHG